MRYLTPFLIFEKKEDINISDAKQKLISKFKSKWGIELDPKFDTEDINTIIKGLEFYNTKFIKNRIDKIIYDDTLNGVHGRWKDTPKKKWMTLNPRIFKFKRKWKEGGISIPYPVFTVVHEIAHCIDHIERISYSKEWQSISGWKKCDINEKVPDGYVRYIEKRKGRQKAGHKKSNWIHKEGADFCRKYTSRNPREDFADCLAFAILGIENKFQSEGGEKKMEILKKLLKKVD
jgi:hypothetical protein